MSDRMINLFLKEVKKANDGLMPVDLKVTVWINGGCKLSATFCRADDAAGVLVLENTMPRQRRNRSGAGYHEVEETDRFYLRYDRIDFIQITL